MAAKIAFVDPQLGPLTDDRLTRDVRVLQREKGHRFSSDDVATAYVAYCACPGARRVLDLGCGLGSVLLQLAWKLPEARLCGVEAQAQSFELLSRNVARSGFAERIRIEHGDLRDPELLGAFGGGFELVTGTPPYFPPSAALDAEDEQRAYARIEYRGGVEAYIAAGSTMLAKDGLFVLCTDARITQRTTSACEAAGLFVSERWDVVPRAGKPALFTVWTLCHQRTETRALSLTLRSETGARTADARTLREFCGFD